VPRTVLKCYLLQSSTSIIIITNNLNQKMTCPIWRTMEHCADLEETLANGGGNRISRRGFNRQSVPNSFVRSKPSGSTARMERRSGSYPVLQLSALYRTKKSPLFANLPREIATKIFAFLDVRSLFLCVLLCSLFGHHSNSNRFISV
jgi:hypothetical protein